MNSDLEKVRLSLLDTVESLKTIASRHHTASILKDLGTIKEIILALPDRIREKELPESYVCTILDNARLDCLISYSTIKVSLLYLHLQSLMSSGERQTQFASQVDDSMAALGVVEHNFIIRNPESNKLILEDMEYVEIIGTQLKQIKAWLTATTKGDENELSSVSTESKKSHSEETTKKQLRSVKNGSKK